ncbi:hypothetical protein [Sphingomonas sp. 1185]|uniref:hypothetical protein n=1 Tax=Sphingomonas sp. 1185 TaxID=3156411 RepID=UPI003393D68A
MSATQMRPQRGQYDSDPGATLASDLRALGEDLHVLGVLAERACTLLTAERLVARRRLRIVVVASVLAAAMLAVLPAMAIGLSGGAIVATALLAGAGAAIPGLALLRRPDLFDRAAVIIARVQR